MVKSCGKTPMVCFPLALLMVSLATSSASLATSSASLATSSASLATSLLGLPEDGLNTTFQGQDDDMAGNIEDFVKRILKVEGRGGSSFKAERDTQEDMDAVCDCLKLKINSVSCYDQITALGPLVLDGRCIGGNMWRRRRDGGNMWRHRRDGGNMWRHRRDGGNMWRRRRDGGNMWRRRRDGGRSDVNDSPILLHDDREMCQGTKTLIFSSSGDKPRLNLGNTPSILICQGSISPHLEHLSISNVKEIWVAAGALQPRDTNLVIHLYDIQNKIKLPEGALFIQASESENYEPQSPPAEMQFIIERATEVEYESRSLVAPRISLVMNDVRNINIGSRAIIPYSPEASFFEVRLSVSLVLETQAMRVGNFKAINISQLTLKEASIDVTTDGGGEMVLEGIKNLVLEDGAARLSPGASLILNNVNINSAGHRAISNYKITTGPLLNVYMQHVNGTTLASGAFCLVVEKVILSNFTVGEQPEVTSTCIQAGTLSSDRSEEPWPGVVACQGVNDTSPLCGDVDCVPCSLPPVESTEVYAGGLPLYAVILAIFAAIIFILLVIFSTCKVLRRNQSAKYKLPRPAPTHTFQKSIVTAENLDTTCKNTGQDNAAPAETYITFSKCEPLEERQVLLHDVDMVPPDFHTLPANAYLPADHTRRISQDSNNCS